MKKVLRIARIFVKKLDQDDCLGLAAEMAYNLALAIVPAILLFVSLMSLIQSPKTALLISDLVGAVLPKEVYQPIDQTIDRVLAERREGIFTVSLIFSFFSTAAVFTTVMKAMERIYNMKLEYSFVRRQLVAAELVLLVSLALGIVFSLILFGAELEKMLEKQFRLRWLGHLVEWTRFPIAFLVMTLSALLVYKFSLRIGQRLSHVLPGATLMATLWIVVCLWYGDYLKYQYYGQGYTVLAKSLATLVWLYINSLIFLIGAEVNWLFYSGTIGKTRSEPARTIAEPQKAETKSDRVEAAEPVPIMLPEDALPLNRVDLPLPATKPPQEIATEKIISEHTAQSQVPHRKE
ncbi:MAG: YihY/virulence factor BrkB family protein [Chloroherpetonaceae bacterium]|nr:YihY/virulence factor BrkB family protein [Chloroherpetonaceae bacterium]